MAFEVGKNRLEALGDVEETADLLRYYSDEMEADDGFVKPMGSLSPTEHTRASSSRTACGGDQPLQLPDGAGRRPGRRGADRRQHGGPEALLGRPADGLQVLRGAARGRHAGRGLQPRDRPRRDGRRRAGGEPRHRRHGLHRQLRGRHEAVHRLHPRLPAPDHHRDGRQEPGDHHRQRRPRRGGGGRDALRLRLRRAEVQRQQPGLRRALRGAVRSSTSWSSAPRGSRSATRPERENWMGPVINERSLGKFTMRWTRRSATAGPSRRWRGAADPGHRARLLPDARPW